MASFAYVARETGSGREIRNSVEATTEQAAIAALLNRNLLVVSIQERIGKKGKTGGGRVGLQDLVIFTRQLATMIDAGLAMVQSLQALAEQTTNKIMRDVIKDVCARVEAGDSFSEALVKHPKAFSRLYVCMVAAGEKGGMLAGLNCRSSAKLPIKSAWRASLAPWPPSSAAASPFLRCCKSSPRPWATLSWRRP